MPSAEMWTEKAAKLRERAKHERDAQKRRVLLNLANSCDALAADLERIGSQEKEVRESQF
jgi:outer membrane protein TolC